MTDRQRNLFLIGLFVAIAAAIFFFGRLLRPSDLTIEQPAVRKTIAAIVSANQTTEALFHQTQTADIHECFCQTSTPERTASPSITPTAETTAITP